MSGERISITFINGMSKFILCMNLNLLNSKYGDE